MGLIILKKQNHENRLSGNEAGIWDVKYPKLLLHRVYLPESQFCPIVTDSLEAPKQLGKGTFLNLC